MKTLYQFYFSDTDGPYVGDIEEVKAAKKIHPKLQYRKLPHMGQHDPKECKQCKINRDKLGRFS